MNEITEQERIKSFIKTRLDKEFGDDLIISFSKKELAKFCLEEIDKAFDYVEIAEFNQENGE